MFSVERSPPLCHLEAPVHPSHSFPRCGKGQSQGINEWNAVARGEESDVIVVVVVTTTIFTISGPLTPWNDLIRLKCSSQVPHGSP